MDSSAEPGKPEKQSVLQGFREFLMRGNVVELAVAVVVGTAFSKIVDSVVKGIINPLVGAIGSKDLENYSSCLVGPCRTDPETGEVLDGVPLDWGPVVSACLTFLITAAVVYFLMILPMNKYKERRAAKLPPVEPEPTEVELLKEIRDALVLQQAGPADGAPGDGTVAPQRGSAEAGKVETGK